MKRNDDVDFLADANGAGRDGFTNGSPDPLVNASEVGSTFCNAVQEEIIRTIELTGGTPSGANIQQMAERLIGLFDGTVALPLPPTRVATFYPQMVSTRITGGLAEWNAGASSVISAADSTDVTFHLPLPHGAVVSKVEARIKPGAARATVGDRMLLQVASRDLDWSSGSVPAGAVIIGTDDRDDGTASIQTLEVGSLSVVIDNIGDASKKLFAIVTSGNTGSTQIDVLHEIRVTYTDAYPGQR